MEENNKHVQPNSKEGGVQRLNRILSESLIKATFFINTSYRLYGLIIPA